MDYIVYILFRIAVFKAWVLPFRLLYILSDILAFFLERVIKYRKKVIYANLKMCFPEKTDKEIATIASKFYLNLSDIILESIKGFSMNEKQLLKRYVFSDKVYLKKYFEEKRQVICTGGHYSNWEWGVLTMGLQYPNMHFGAYKPLSNKFIDAYIVRKRTRPNMTLVTMEETVRVMKNQKGTPSLFVLIADQSPSSHKKAVWIDFFDTKTACVPGVEISAKLFDMGVVYMVSKRIKRGYYRVDLTPVTDNPGATEKGFITQQYMKHLEDDIRERPEWWLWSHRRWKHRYEDVFGVH